MLFCLASVNYLGVSYTHDENVNPPSSQSSWSLPCDTTSYTPSVVVKEAWEVWEGWTGSGSLDSLRKQSK